MRSCPAVAPGVPCAGVGLLALPVLLAGACECPWPLEGRYDPTRCDPRCTTGEICDEGRCVKVDASLTLEDGLNPPNDGADKDAPVVPAQWITSAGGSRHDYSRSIALDKARRAYITGDFQGTASFGSITITSSGSLDLFVAKLDASGKFLWATSAGGATSDTAVGIALDSAGNSYITGYFHSPAVFGSITLTASGSSADLYIAKLDTSGKFLWATSAGSVSGVYGNAIALDSAGNAYGKRSRCL